jgi:predicted phosphodiesterase
MISRRHFLTESALAVAAGSLAATGSSAHNAAGAGTVSPFSFASAPVLTNPTPDGISILWATTAPATGWVEYGATAALGQRATGSTNGLMPFDERCFKIRLRDLKPGTRYHYRVHAVRVDFKNAYKIIREEEVVSDIYSFTTSDPAANSTRFTIWNDTHENAATLTALHEAHQAVKGDFLLWNGDQTNDIYSEEKMVGQFLSPAGLPFATSTPLHYVRGNHDVRGPAARRLDRFTDVPDGSYYYSFRQGPLAALVMDAGEDKFDTHPVYAGLNDFAAFRSQQAEWLAREIEKAEFRSAPYRVVFCHIPLWWTDETKADEGWYSLDAQQKWHDLLVKGGVQLVISGHTHEHAWMPPDAKRPYGQLIGGGPKPAAATYMRGVADGKRLEITMHWLDGTVLETVSIRPHEA